MNAKVILWLDGRQQGPFSEAEVSVMLHSRRIDVNTLAAPAGSEVFMPLRDMLKPSSKPSRKLTAALKVDVTKWIGLALVVVGGFLAVGSLVGYTTTFGSVFGVVILLVGVLVRVLATRKS